MAIVSALLISTILSSCQGRAPSYPADSHSGANDTSGLDQKKRINELTRYIVSGEITYSSTSTSSHTQFFWKHDHPDRYKLVLLDPFGNAQLTLAIKDRKIASVSKAYKRYLGSSIESLVFNSSGISIPLGELFQLLIIVLDQGVQQGSRSQKELMKLNPHESQHCWSFTQKEYKKYDGLLLPSKLVLGCGLASIDIYMNDWIVS